MLFFINFCLYSIDSNVIRGQEITGWREGYGIGKRPRTRIQTCLKYLLCDGFKCKCVKRLGSRFFYA